ncbi:MAG TPA: hypothetical protein VK921_05745 [Anditalea sp.]|nr:hypothetical protein [Anditalea sp.]
MKGIFLTAAFILVCQITMAQTQLITALGLTNETLFNSDVNISIGEKDEFTSYSYYETGELKAIKPIVDGKFEGELMSFYRDGSLRRREFFENGESLGGICFDMDGKISAYEPFMQYASLRGDLDAAEFVDQHSSFIFRTKKSMEIEELKVILNISHLGKLVGYDFLTEVDNGTQQRVAYVLRQMSDWNPAMEEGMFVPMEYELTIR